MFKKLDFLRFDITFRQIVEKKSIFEVFRTFFTAKKQISLNNKFYERVLNCWHQGRIKRSRGPLIMERENNSDLGRAQITKTTQISVREPLI